MSEAKYVDPTVAYNTGYNDGQREERTLLAKRLSELEIAVLADKTATVPRAMGRLHALLRELTGGP